ncbi:MAG: hypothetical protein HY000_15455 [Planctomycetes bacterium]|nr:hypothetical protein [Planctomycetota bacterium]
MVAYSPDGLRLASASDDRTIRIWDIVDLREIRRLEGHSDAVTAIQFSPDGGRIISGSRDGTVRIWDVQTETQLQSFAMGEFRSSVGALAWSPDGGSFLIGARVVGAPSLALWNVGLAKEERVFGAKRIDYLRSTLEGNKAFYSAGTSLWMWEVGTEAPINLLETGSRLVVVSDDGRRALAAGAERGIKLWDLDRREVVKSFAKDQRQQHLVALALSSDQRRGIVADGEGLIRVVDLPAPPPPQGQLQLVELPSPVECVAISNDGFHAVVGAGHEFNAWELQQTVGNLAQRTQDRVSAIAFSRDTGRILYGTGQPNSRANYVGLRVYARTGRDWAIAGQRDLRQFKGATDRITGVAFMSGGRRVLSGGADGALRLWDVQSEQQLDTITVGLPINGLAVSNGRHVLLGLDDNDVRLWDWEVRREVKRFRGHTFYVLAVGLSADGRRAVSGSGDRTVRVWDVETGECLATLTGHSDRVRAVAISADGATVLSGSDDSTVRLWDVATARAVRVFSGHRGAVHAVAMSPDGKRGLSGGEDQTARLWDPTLKEESN